MDKAHVDTLRKFQRHHLLRQFGENGRVLPENMEVSTALDAVLAAARGDFRWLIETPGPRYLGVRKLNAGNIHDFIWTTDHNAALSFKTQEQADRTMMALRQMNRDLFAFAPTLGDAKAIEHGWI